MRVAVRGIYSTALVRLLLDEGFEVVRPTRSQRERFGIPGEAVGEPDAMLSDARNRHYLEVQGVSDAVEAVVEVLRSKVGDVVVLWAGRGEEARARVGFPSEAKQALDELRSRVAYTVPWHHYCRAGGDALSTMVSFAEDLVEAGLADGEEVAKLFDETVRRAIPRRGVIAKIIHEKLDGKTLKLRPGRVIWRGEGEVKLQRRILGTGVYDGLGIPKSPGDYAITEAKLMEWYTKTRYYDVSGRLKGTYYNICTPVALYPDHIHYFDLEVDVVVRGEVVEVIDDERLELVAEEGRIPEELKRVALRKAEELASKQP